MAAARPDTATHEDVIIKELNGGGQRSLDSCLLIAVLTLTQLSNSRGVLRYF